MIDIYQLFAKTDPYVSLYQHCCGVGETAGRLWDLGLIEQDIIKREHLCLLAALHDLGKCHPSFQRKGAESDEYSYALLQQGFLAVNNRFIRHELVSEYLLKDRAGDFSSVGIASAFSRILGLHHQKQDKGTVCASSPKREEWIKAQNKLLAAIEKHFDVTLKEVEFNTGDAVCVKLWGMVILSDWLTSGGVDNKAELLFEFAPLPAKPITELFGLKELRPLQRACEIAASGYKSNPPLAIILEAPMGEGKTEAALYLAAQLMGIQNKKGIYVALPTMATARQMESRVSALLKQNGAGGARLVHSEAWLDIDVQNSEEIDKSWFTPAKRALLSSYAVGTVDQAMMSVLKIRNGVLRLLGLSGKVLVIDEMHAYDTYMQTIILRLMEWCRALQIPVIILSATLPSERRRKLISVLGAKTERLSDDYPLITAVYGDGAVSEHKCGSYIKKDVIWENRAFVDYEDTAYIAAEAVKDGGCACVIMNTVADAQRVYRAVKDFADKDTEVLLFHSRFTAKARREIERKCMEAFGKNGRSRPKKAILVATQVAEQSLNVDFDYMISAIAPIDLLLQRCGRLHRHERVRPETLKNPRFTVLIESAEKSMGISSVYEPWIVRQTRLAVSKICTLSIPADIRRLVEQVYEAKPERYEAEDADFQNWMKLKSMYEISEGKAKSVVFPTPRQNRFFALRSEEEYYDEASDELVSSDAMTRAGGANIKLALLPADLWREAELTNPSLAFARQVMDHNVPVRLGKESALYVTDGIIECGGYLRGVYAMKQKEVFQLQFSRWNSHYTKWYTVDDEYGLKEEL